jgi:hypothetical protein
MDDCSNFNGDTGCTSGQQTRYPDDWSKRSFQTFLKDGPDAHLYKPEYEGLGRVMCFNDIIYSADRSSANVTAKCRKHDSITKMEYNFNNEGFQSNATYAVNTSFSDALSLVVKATDGDGKEYTITQEVQNFVW